MDVAATWNPSMYRSAPKSPVLGSGWKGCLILFNNVCIPNDIQWFQISQENVVFHMISYASMFACPFSILAGMMIQYGCSFWWWMLQLPISSSLCESLGRQFKWRLPSRVVTSAWRRGEKRLGARKIRNSEFSGRDFRQTVGFSDRILGAEKREIGSSNNH